MVMSWFLEYHDIVIVLDTYYGKTIGDNMFFGYLPW